MKRRIPTPRRSRPSSESGRIADFRTRALNRVQKEGHRRKPTHAAQWTTFLLLSLLPVVLMAVEKNQPLTISAVEIQLIDKGSDARKHLSVSYTATANLDLASSEKLIQVSGKCLVEGRVKTDKVTMSQGMFEGMSKGDSHRFDEAFLFLLSKEGLGAKPSQCTLSFTRFARKKKDRLLLAEYCWRAGTVSPGACK